MAFITMNAVQFGCDWLKDPSYCILNFFKFIICNSFQSSPCLSRSCFSIQGNYHFKFSFRNLCNELNHCRQAKPISRRNRSNQFSCVQFVHQCFQVHEKFIIHHFERESPQLQRSSGEYFVQIQKAGEGQRRRDDSSLLNKAVARTINWNVETVLNK